MSKKVRVCPKCGSTNFSATNNGPEKCKHGVSMKKHCCECERHTGRATK